MTPRFVVAVVEKLGVMYCDPGDILCEQEQQALQVFFLSAGMVQVRIHMYSANNRCARRERQYVRQYSRVHVCMWVSVCLCVYSYVCM